MGYIINTPYGRLLSTIVDRVESLETILAHLLPEMTSNILGPVAMIEYVKGIEVIRSFNQSANSYKKYSDAVNDNASYAVNWMRDCEFYKAMGMSVWLAVLVMVLSFGCYFTMNGTLKIPVFITVIALSMGIVKPIPAALNFVDSITTASTIVSEVCEILDTDELIRPEQKIDIRDHTIELQNVIFSYSEKEHGNKILKGINLTIKPGTVTAFAGPSGT
jgi:ATP-binding cassette subfamily B protein